MNTENTNTNTECSICYDSSGYLSNRCITACGHIFCITCFIQSIQYNNVCPMCRSELYNPLSIERKNKNSEPEIENVQEYDHEYHGNQNENENDSTNSSYDIYDEDDADEDEDDDEKHKDDTSTNTSDDDISVSVYTECSTCFPGWKMILWKIRR